jgi:hypothetical protein
MRPIAVSALFNIVSQTCSLASFADFLLLFLGITILRGISLSWGAPAPFHVPGPFHDVPLDTRLSSDDARVHIKLFWGYSLI